MADDVVTISTIGTGQYIDNASVQRASGLTVDRQRVTLKGDLYADAPPLIEIYLLQMIELQRQQLVEMKIQNFILQETQNGLPGATRLLDDIEVMRRDPAFNDVQPR